MYEQGHSFSWRSGLLELVRPAYPGIRIQLMVECEGPMEVVNVTISHAIDLVPPMSFALHSSALIRLRARGIWQVELACPGHDDLELRFDARNIHDTGRTLLANRVLQIRLMMKATTSRHAQSARVMTGQIDETGLHWTIVAKGLISPSDDQPPSLLAHG